MNNKLELELELTSVNLECGRKNLVVNFANFGKHKYEARTYPAARWER